MKVGKGLEPVLQLQVITPCNGAAAWNTYKGKTTATEEIEVMMRNTWLVGEYPLFTYALWCLVKNTNHGGISIVDPAGRLVYTMVAPNLQAGKQLVTINKDLVAPGIYMLSITTSQKIETIAFVKE